MGLSLIILIGIILIILAVFALTCLSYFTLWPRRTRSFFFAPNYRYNPDKQISNETTRFSSLLSAETTSWRGPQHTHPEIYLTVVIPAMNEEKRLPSMLDQCLDYLRTRTDFDENFTYEIIVVDDGSSDNTADLAYSYGNPVSVLRLPKNLGKGGAVRMGVLCSRGQFILFADADGATQFPELGKLEHTMRRLCNGEVMPSSRPADWTHPAIVVGSRAHMEKNSIAQRSIIRTFLMFGFHALVYIFTVRSIRDTQCGFKLFSRAAAAKLFPQIHIEGWAFDVELLFIAERMNFSIEEVAVEWAEIDGSKIVPIFSWLQMGRDIILIWFRYICGIWRINNMKEWERKI